jgi:hypothetical protein
MVDLKQGGPRPLWVRFGAPERRKRSTAVAQVGGFVFLAAIGLLGASVEFGSSSLLGKLALPGNLAVACLCASAALWSLLAVRWVDQNGNWG